MSNGLILALEHRQQMIQHIRSCLPEEACGLIGGIENRAVQIFPIENEYHSRVRFRMKPEEQLSVFLTLEQNGLDLIGIYHSHPTGPEFPSETDRSEFAYPGTSYLILSPHGVDWQVRGFQMNAEQFIEFALNVF
jgi:[CysO sulfur-carrier protein]-S-L-cysteine hydrolase